MADGVLLKTSKENYLNKIQVLGGHISHLNSIKSRYQGLLNQLSSEVIGEGDANFSAAESNVQENIRAVTQSITLCENAREQLQKFVENLEELEQGVGEGFQTGAGIIGDAIDIARNIFT